MLGSKSGNVRHSVRHLTAYRIKALEDGIAHDMFLTILDDAMELIQALRGLGIEIDVLGEVQLAFLSQMLHILKLLYHDGMAFGLSHQSQHLGMSLLAKDDDLGIRIVGILLLDTLLQLQDHRTGRINDLYLISLCQSISLRWFSMGTEQDLDTMKLSHLLMIDGCKSSCMKALHLHAVMHNITQAIEFATLCQFLLRLLDGSGHTEAKTTAIVYLNLHDNSNDK